MSSINTEYTFSHRVLAEYLCAQALLNDAKGHVERIPEIGKRVWDSRWEMTVRYIVELSKNPVAMLWEALNSLPTEFGVTESKWLSPNHSNRPLVLILSGAVMNSSMRFREAELLRVMIRRNLIKLVTAEGACGEIDTTWFRAFPDAQIRKDVASHFVKKMEITGPEYCQIGLDVNFDFFGADDKEMFTQQLKLLVEEKNNIGSLPAFQSFVPGVYELTEKRCRAMAQNTLDRMRHIGVNTAVLHVGRTFDFAICDTLKAKDVSNIVIKTNSDEPDNWDIYSRVLTGDKEPLEKVLGGSN